MKITFWGVRGSFPKSITSDDIKKKIKMAIIASKNIPLNTIADVDGFIESLPDFIKRNIGGNTSCIEINCDGEIIILDAGSGLKNLGQRLVQEAKPLEFEDNINEDSFENALKKEMKKAGTQVFEEKKIKVSLLVSHTHWDHIMGFPFFLPAFSASATIDIYGLNADLIEYSFLMQQLAPKLFPVAFEQLAAEINFLNIENNKIKINGVTVETFLLPHPGDVLSYKITYKNKVLVYASDYEFQPNDKRITGFIEFIKNADVLIADSQYTYLESVAREGWGHSTSFKAVDFALEANVKKLYLFHYDPEHCDKKMYDILLKTKNYYETIKQNRELTIELAVEEFSFNI